MAPTPAWPSSGRVSTLFEARGAGPFASRERSIGLTSARWQVLGAIAYAQQPLTVPQIARRMGLTRQSVHTTASRLLADGMVELVPNEDHRRSPLVRLTERNAYRTSLINYQRARRNLMNLEDSVAAQVRFDVRQLHLFADNYKIQKKVLESLYSQVENALEVIAAPVDPDQLKSTGTTGQANAAALTNQYLTALSGLNNAQTKMYDIWLSLLATRMELYQDLERLPLDNRGVWIDDYATSIGTSDPQRGQQPATYLPRATLLPPATD